MNPVPGVSGSGDTDANGIASSPNSMVLTQSSGNYYAKATCVTCGGLYITHAYTITKEWVNLDYTGDPVVALVGGIGSVNVSAAVLEETDGYPGTLLNPQTKVKFELFDGSTSMGTCTAPVIAAATLGTGTASCTTAPTMSGITNPVTLSVVMTLIDDPTPIYYEGNGEGSVTVQIAQPGFSSVGAWFYDPIGGGRINTGVTATYNDLKKKIGARGNAVIILRRTMNLRDLAPTLPDATADYNIIIKSTATTAAGSSQYIQQCTGTNNTAPCYFTFAGKATIKAVNRNTGASYNIGDAMGGNGQFQVDGADFAEPGSTQPDGGPDTFAFRAWAALGDIFEIDGKMANPVEINTYEGDLDTITSANSRQQIPIRGGNVQVRLK
jgi:hypothetical protein